MIAPHGSAELRPLLVADPARRDALAREAASLPALTLTSRAASNVVMLASGYFNPLTGFMNVAEATTVAERMQLHGGAVWPVPVLNAVSPATASPALRSAKRIALRDPNLPGEPILAILDVAAVEELRLEQAAFLIERTFGTADPKHPGVADFVKPGDLVFSGGVQALNLSYFPAEFPDTFRTAGALRDEFKQRGWNRVVAFQTRNPMHLAHEELCRMAMSATGADGLLIHMVLGRLKAGDIPAQVRDASIRKMVEVYFKPNSALIAGYGFDMLYAGPREAVLHAIIRQNCGCSHLIVGRDHAGVGSYYGPFDAQTIFDTLPTGGLKIEIFRADHTAWSKKLGRVVMMRDCPDHKPEDYVNLSGTKVRELLAAGQPLPREFARPEVAAILSEYYQREARGG